MARRLRLPPGVNRYFQQIPERSRETGQRPAQVLRSGRLAPPQALRTGPGSEVTMIASSQTVKTPDAALAASLVGPALRLVVAMTLCLFCLVTVCGAVIVK